MMVQQFTRAYLLVLFMTKIAILETNWKLTKNSWKNAKKLQRVQFNESFTSVIYKCKRVNFSCKV